MYQDITLQTEKEMQDVDFAKHTRLPFKIGWKPETKRANPWAYPKKTTKSAETSAEDIPEALELDQIDEEKAPIPVMQTDQFQHIEVDFISKLDASKLQDPEYLLEQFQLAQGEVSKAVRLGRREQKISHDYRWYKSRAQEKNKRLEDMRNRGYHAFKALEAENAKLREAISDYEDNYSIYREEAAKHMHMANRLIKQADTENAKLKGLWAKFATQREEFSDSLRKPFDRDPRLAALADNAIASGEAIWMSQVHTKADQAAKEWQWVLKEKVELEAKLQKSTKAMEIEQEKKLMDRYHNYGFEQGVRVGGHKIYEKAFSQGWHDSAVHHKKITKKEAQLEIKAKGIRQYLASDVSRQRHAAYWLDGHTTGRNEAMASQNRVTQDEKLAYTLEVVMSIYKSEAGLDSDTTKAFVADIAARLATAAYKTGGSFEGTPWGFALDPNHERSIKAVGHVRRTKSGSEFVMSLWTQFQAHLSRLLESNSDETPPPTTSSSNAAPGPQPT